MGKRISNYDELPFANKKVYDLIVFHTNGNISMFAEYIGVSQQVLERIFRKDKRSGKYPRVSDGIKEALKGKFNLSDVWFVDGDSNAVEIPVEEKGSFYTETTNGTPVYDIDATCGTESRNIEFTDEHVIGYIDLPGVNKNAYIIRANGDSMEPRIFDGNMVAIREIKSWEDVFYGQIYLILLDEYRMIKYIRKYEPDEENYIILRSENPAYDDIKLHKSKIRKLFIVENILSIKVQL